MYATTPSNVYTYVPFEIGIANVNVSESNYFDKDLNNTNFKSIDS
jgi:hypothetical protein